MRRAAPVLAFGSLGLLAVSSALPAHAQGAIAFDPPVKLTQFAACGGYEPGVMVDTYGNIVVTAHKQNHCDGAAVDPQGSPVPARGESWLWTSTDGVHFTDMPGLSAGGVDTGADRLDVGDEGHVVRDDSGNIYFADLKLADDTFTAYKATGLGQVGLTSHSPLVVTAQGVDDRPWLAAHGNGVVMLASNSGDSAVYSSPNGNGKGRYTLYMSYDGGATFDHVGVTIPNSGWCFPAADHRPGSQDLYVACGDDNGHLFAYVSHDDGHTASGWTSHPIGTYNPNSNAWGSSGSWPILSVAPDGTLYVLHVDQDGSAASGAFHFHIYRSTDQGTTWADWDATPQQGTISSNAGPAWLDVAPDGSLGIDYFVEPPGDTNWHTMAGTTPAWGTPFTVGDASPGLPPGSDSTVTPWGDFLSCAFDPQGRLDVAWTGIDSLGDGGLLNSDVYFARQTGAPNVDVPEAPLPALLLVPGFAAVALTGGVLRRRRGAARG